MTNKHKVGDELFFVHRSRSEKRAVKIKAVGRIWVTLDVAHETHRFAIDDAEMNVMIPNYSGIGRCYFSEKDYLEEKALDVAWTSFRHAISGAYCKPKGATVESIAEARKLLGIDGGAA